MMVGGDFVKLNHIVKKAVVVMASMSLLVNPTWAAEEEKPVLELQKAIDMAISKDDTLGQYSRNITVYEEQKESMKDVSSVGYSSKKIDIEETEQKKAFRKDVIARDVTVGYENMVLLEKNIELLDKQISLGEKQVKQAQIKKEKGYCDELTYEKTVQELENTKVSKAQAEKNLEDAKKSFLQLTNLNVDKYTLVADETYTPLTLEKSINEYASGMATTLTKYDTEQAQLNEEHFWDTIYKSGEGGTGPTYVTYLEQKANVQTTKENVKSAYDAYKLLIETRYTALNTQLDVVKNKMDNYKTSEKDMKVAEIKYNAGYVSAIDYETQKVQLAALEVDYLEQVFKYNQLKAQIEKPWTMSEYAF